MNFFLNHNPTKSIHLINHTQNILLIGSCFSENIGEKLSTHYFKTLINPNGILFNPNSIYNSIKGCLNSDSINDSTIINRNGIYLSFDYHSSIFDVSKEELISKFKRIQTYFNTYIKQSNHIIITFGSAYIYQLKSNNTVVANCHKLSKDNFEKKLLSVNDIVSDYKQLINQLNELNPNINIVFTVSPVKYLKDGVEENTISKATLLLAVNQICKETKAHYFPAFELVNDDLRDYRFYKEDMAHPNQQAINYVWEKFSDTFFSEETKQLNKELYSIRQSENHKLLFPDSDEAKTFRLNLENKKQTLKNKFPFLDI